jgi:hypothetical protein
MRQVEGASAAEVQEEMRELADAYAAMDFDGMLGDPTCAVCGDVGDPHTRTQAYTHTHTLPAARRMSATPPAPRRVLY